MVDGDRANRIGQLAIDAETAKKESQEANSFGGQARRFLSAIPGELANAFVKNPARLATSAVVAPVDVFRGGAGQQPLDVNLPFVGKTFQRQASEEMQPIFEKAYAGEKLGLGDYATSLKPFAEVPLAAAETLGVASTLKSIPGAVKNAPGQVRSFLNSQANKKTQNLLGSDKAFNDALKISREKLTPGMEEAAFIEGRVGKQRLFKGAPVLPSRQEIRVAEAVQPLVEGGKITTKMAPAQKVSVLKQEIGTIDQEVKQMLSRPEYNIPFNAGQLKARLNAAKDDLRVVFASDPSTERTFDAVSDAFMESVKKKNMLGLFEGRQSFDQIPAIKKLLDGMKGAQGENLRREVILAIRNAANEYVGSSLPTNNPFRSSLKTESSLIRAIENIATQNKGITNEGLILSFLKSPVGRATQAGVVGLGLTGAAVSGGKALLGE